MPSRLQEQRIGNDSADRGKRQRAGNHVLWTMQQRAHQKAALVLRFDRGRSGATAAARHVVIPGDFSRHFSSPVSLGPGWVIAAPDSALRYCSTVAPAAA